MSKEKFSFQAEVGKILDVVAHSLYSQSEIFIREYISNASDACDKLRYESIKNPSILNKNHEFKILIKIDPKASSISIEDNGIGMSKEDMINNLGTIAKSGTESFVKEMSSEDKKGDMSLIGQFGVGFYSGFMVAKEIKVISKQANSNESWAWVSDGKGQFTVEKADRENLGTEIILNINDKSKEFLETIRINTIITKYSDHIAQPVYLENLGDKDHKETLVNSASAIWTRDKKDISKEQYKEFYNSVAMTYDNPWMVLHNKNEGMINYTNLIFIPSERPHDIFTPDRKINLKLYVKKVFITDNCEGILPAYLRFVKGVIDSEDIALNVSREMLQHNPSIQKINNGLVKRVINELTKSSDKKREEFIEFWKSFGMVLKEGIHEDFTNREKILSLSLFETSIDKGWTNLTEYKDRLKEGQESIFYISGESKEQLLKSPQLETFISNDIEVLLMTDPVDEFWLSSMPEFKGTKFKSITKGDIDISKIKLKKKDTSEKNKNTIKKEDLDSLISYLKICYGENVKDVKVSNRLTESPVCLVAEETEMDIHLENLLNKNKQIDRTSTKILEVNSSHKLIKSISGLDRSIEKNRKKIEDMAFLLLDQAKIMEGLPVGDSREFSERINRALLNNF